MGYFAYEKESLGGEIKYIFRAIYSDLPRAPDQYKTMEIRAHGEKEAYKKAQKQAAMWHMEFIPNEQHNDLIWERIEVKPRKPKPKNKHPAKPPDLNDHERNELVKQIETEYRTQHYAGRNNSRLGSIPAADVRRIIWKHKIGFICKYCLVDFRGRYCCPEHSQYYRTISMSMFGPQQPWEDGTGLDSIDHIKPISMGSLEFDKDNLQWMDLAENIRKGGINRIKAQQKAQIKTQLQLASKQAQSLYEAMGFGQHTIKRYLEEVVK